MKQPAVYIMVNQRNGTLYVGVTSDLIKRVYQHREGSIQGFSKKYSCKMLVFYEQFPTMMTAIEKEKQIKGGSRKKKLKLIEYVNPRWEDLYENIL